MKRKYKFNYTEADVEKQAVWFEAHKDELPKSLQISESTKSPDLAYTLSGLFQTLRNNKPSVIFSGYYETLLKIRDRLQEEGVIE